LAEVAFSNESLERPARVPNDPSLHKPKEKAQMTEAPSNPQGAQAPIVVNVSVQRPQTYTPPVVQSQSGSGAELRPVAVGGCGCGCGASNGGGAGV